MANNVDVSSLPDRFLPPEQAAAFLSLSPSTLASWRSLGAGPRFRKVGAGRSAAIRYALSDLRAFMADPAPACPPKRPFRKPRDAGQPNVALGRARRRKTVRVRD